MSLAFILRPFLLRGRNSLLIIKSHTLGSVQCENYLYHRSVTKYVSGQTYSKMMAEKRIHQFKQMHHLTNVANRLNNPGFIILQSSSSMSTTEDSEQEVEKEKRKGLLRRNSIRRDRQESAELFRNRIQEKGDTPWSFEDWIELSEQLMQLTGSWEVMCMHTLLLDSNIEVGKSLMAFLESRSEGLISPAITTFYIGLLGKTSFGDKAQEIETKKYYDDLVSSTDVLDAASIEVLVEGLSGTSFYKECINLLHICRLSSPPGFSIIRNILKVSMRHHDIESSSFALHQCEDTVGPTQLISTATDIIDIAVESKNQEGLRQFFNFMQKHSLSLVRDQLELVQETFQSGKCSVCQHQMPKLHISDEEFNAVRSAFLDQVIVSDNIFYKTSPQEVSNFIKFVDKFGPFDVVIDGMNALHAGSPKKPQKAVLEKLVRHFIDEGKSILVLGSRVLRPSVKRFEGFRPRPAVYLTTTTRADDAFFLYAALHSGKSTIIVSADKLRDHKFRLEPYLRPIFHQWLTSIQVYSFINPRTNVVNPKRHLFNLGPKEDESGWHIPVNDVDMERTFGRQGTLCLRHGPENFIEHKSFRPQSIKSNRSRQRPDDNLVEKEWFEL